MSRDFHTKAFGAQDFGASNFAAKDFAAKPFGNEAAQAVAGAIDGAMGGAAKDSPGSFLAQVVTSSRGYYDLIKADGSSVRHIGNATRQRFDDDSWVSVSVTGEGIMQISGPGSAKSS